MCQASTSPVGQGQPGCLGSWPNKHWTRNKPVVSGSSVHSPSAFSPRPLGSHHLPPPCPTPVTAMLASVVPRIGQLCPTPPTQGRVLLLLLSLFQAFTSFLHGSPSHLLPTIRLITPLRGLPVILFEVVTPHPRHFPPPFPLSPKHFLERCVIELLIIFDFF